MKIKILGKKVVSVYPSGGKFCSIPGDSPVQIFQSGISWIICDNFYPTDRAAGSVNGTAAEPGPGVRTVVDTENKLSVAGGALTFAGGKAAPAWGDPAMRDGLQTRIAGKMLIFQITPVAPNTGSFVGWWNTTTAGSPSTSADTGVDVNVTPVIQARGVDHGGATLLSTWVAGTSYKMASLLRTTGNMVFIKSSGNWLLLWIGNTGNRATLYPGVLTYDPFSTLSFIRISQALWLPTPLLSDGFGGTWPYSDGGGHVEPLGTLGGGGNGKVWLDMGNAAIAGGELTITPTIDSVEGLKNPGAEGTYTAGLAADWAKQAEITATEEGVLIYGGSKAQRATTSAINKLIYTTRLTDSVVGKWYRLSGWLYLVAGTARLQEPSGGLSPSVFGPIVTTTGSYVYTFFTGYAAAGGVSLGTRLLDLTTDVITDDVSRKLLPISSLITNQSLITADVLAEAVISAYPGAAGAQSTQVGMVLNADRSFAAKCAATAAAGQAVISLKEVTGVGGAGLAVTDGITIKHAGGDVIYTIASVAGGSNVAYNDALKTQTITLGANLSEEVAVDGKVGLDWASWNGVICYFNGAGNINLDEVKAGVYTNRGTTATTFVAAKRLIVRKTGTEYRIFFNEALVGTAISTVDAAAMAGKYHGLFSTSVLNTITSMVVYDTGAVSNLYSNLDRFSKD